MKTEEITYSLEDVHFKLWVLKSLASAVNDAIVYSPCESSRFHGALYALTHITHELENEVGELVDASFQNLKKQKI